MAAGTSSIIDETTHEPLISILSVIVETAVKLQNDGHKVVLVSSGAIGVGLRRMDLDKRPKHLPRVQALAAIGQCRLMSLWDQLFSVMRQPVAQILLTRNDIADRTQYRNAQNTFFQLLDMGVVPIVNENDTLAVTEIKFGDNDTLSAITAGMIHADYLFLLTDVDCLYDKNPRLHPDAKPIQVVDDIDKLEVDVSSKGSSLGTGGMYTKIVAARRATSVGVTTVITRSSNPGCIRTILDSLESGQDEAPLHTRFLPSANPIRDRHFWLLHIFAPHGNIYIDDKAHRALLGKANLFPSGIVEVEGTFAQQEAVRIFLAPKPAAAGSTTPPRTPGGEREGPEEVGRAIMNYSSTETNRIKGLRSSQISAALGYAESEYAAFRENIALFKVDMSRSATPKLDNVADGAEPATP
jgi:glutamate 5-kinase